MAASAALLDDDLARRREEVVVGGQRRVLRVDPGLLEQLPVVEDHHRVRLPRQLVVLAVLGLVLLRQVTAALLDVLLAARELSSATSPPCFWNCGTAAGEVLKIRHGALPAVIDAPMTSSEVLPAGISCPVTFSFGCAAFHFATAALPQATSSLLFEYQILIGPVAAAALSASSEPPPPQPATARTDEQQGQR